MAISHQENHLRGPGRMPDNDSHYLPTNLILGIDQMDKQHAHLFAGLDALKARCLEQNALPQAEAEALLRALEEHFASEHALADDVAADFSTHDRKHQAMIGGIRKMVSEVQHGRLDVFSLLRYVEYWFERHILDEDQLLAAKIHHYSKIK